MPRIPDTYQDTVVYLYPTVAAARAGEDIGGTGFLVGFRERDRPFEYVYAVTCAHVVEGGSSVIRLNTKDGELDTVNLKKIDWLQHPGGIDLAVCQLELDERHKFEYVGINDLLNEGHLSKFNIGPGDEVFMAGRFVNHDGKQKNTPTLRFGNIAMMPGEPLSGWQSTPQKSFLVDMRSRTVFSGSPVFIYIPPTNIRLGLRCWPNDKSNTFFGPWLLGVNWGHIPIASKILGPDRDEYGHRKPIKEDWIVESNSGMNAVTPAWDLTEFILDDPQFQKQRDETPPIKKKFIGGSAIPESSERELAPPTTAENPQHREDFSRLLDAAAKGRKPSPRKA